jgi:hypothetical protein
MKCEFDSYPPPVIQWIKNNQMVLDKNNPQVEEIITKQIGPTIYETQLKVVWFLLIEILNFFIIFDLV